MGIPSSERETVLRWDMDGISLWTSDPRTVTWAKKRKLKPVQVQEFLGKPVSWFYRLEGGWSLLPRPKRIKVMTDEQRQEAAERLSKARKGSR